MSKYGMVDNLLGLQWPTDVSESFLNDGFDIIKAYDDATYQAMRRDGWTPLLNLDIFAQKTKMSLPQYINEAPVAMGAFGMTGHGTEYSLINQDAIEAFAHHFRFPAKYMAAAVMVHEYTHTLDHAKQTYATAQQGEITAFTAGRNFAAKLPSEYAAPIVRETDRDLKHAKEDIHSYLNGN
jgi:hypothetical protein